MPHCRGFSSLVAASSLRFYGDLKEASGVRFLFCIPAMDEPLTEVKGGSPVFLVWVELLTDCAGGIV